ncbi:UNVERIFIED_CONTAM: hypothetical protein HDU68_002347 [Siphonaria sp. JEL0065]|nr:hypothetical protein HDU68_002347 [Siphonaria sp. JEL0065]
MSESLPPPKKGILKTHNQSLSDYNQQSDQSAAKLKWDEDNLMITEAQKNSTMKITEPKTPFIHYNMSTDEITGHSGEVPPMKLNDALEYVAIQQLNRPSSSGSSFMLTSDTESLHSESGNSMTGVNHSHHHAVIAKGEWDEDDESEKDPTHGMTPEEYEKHLKFEKLRTQHYNMKEKLAEARRKMAQEDEGEDSKDGEDDQLEVEEYEENDEEDA